MLGGGLVTSWELVLVSGVWRGWVADSFSCFFKSKLLVLRCVIFLFFNWGVLGDTVGRFFLWGVLRGRVVCLQLRLHVLGGRWRWWRF